ncbi:Glyoxalase-like domain [Actinobacillus pleuropneumoniae]|jgi:catechol 2,3-dioxygenase-like lactoylglutathione lyase family enzyme|nr:Glyoxalase-like domain [Actinobacillus pleuropneumoniae]
MQATLPSNFIPSASTYEKFLLSESDDCIMEGKVAGDDLMSKIQFSAQVRLVSDISRSKQFYEEVLGCEVNDVLAIRDDFALGFKLIQAATITDVNPNPAGKDQQTPWDTYAYVDTHHELDELYEELTSSGAEVVQEPLLMEADWGVWKDFAIKDPDNYVIAFGSGKRN